MADSTAESGGKEIPDLVPEEWELNDFLLVLNDDLTDEDFTKMKHMCSGKGGIGKGTLESLSTPLDFFNLLRQQEKISKDNLILLQALVWRIGRKDIHKKFVEFSREFGETLHFHPLKDKPENGYKHLKFCVGGNTDEYSIQKLKNLQWQVARLLRVPIEFVYIKGVEPSNSLVVTFMVPEDVLEVLSELTESERQELHSCGLTFLEYDDIKIDLSEEIQDTSTALDVIQDNIQLREKQLKQEREIEKLQMNLIACNKELKTNSRRGQRRTKNAGTQKSFSEVQAYLYNASTVLSNHVPSCKMVAAQMLQKRMLRRTRELGYDENDIQLLLEANSVIIREHFTTRNQAPIKKLLQDIGSLKNENIWLQYENNKLKFYRGMDLGDKVLSRSDEFFVVNLFRMALSPIKVGINIGTETILDPVFVMAALRQLAKAMTPTEKRMIQNSANFSEEEKVFIKKNPDDLLVKMNEKYMRQRPFPLDIDEWLKKVLGPLQNPKLLDKAYELLHSPETNTSHKKHKTSSKAEQQRMRHASSEGAETRNPKEKNGDPTKNLEQSHIREDADASESDSGIGETHSNFDDMRSRINILTNLVCNMNNTLASIDQRMAPFLAMPEPEKRDWKGFL